MNPASTVFVQFTVSQERGDPVIWIRLDTIVAFSHHRVTTRHSDEGGVSDYRVAEDASAISQLIIDAHQQLRLQGL